MSWEAITSVRDERRAGEQPDMLVWHIETVSIMAFYFTLWISFAD